MAYINPTGFRFTWGGRRIPTGGAFGPATAKPPVAVKPAAPAAPTAPKPPSQTQPSGAPQGFTQTPANLPPDPVYQAQIGGLAQTRDNTLSGLTQQRGAYLQSAGFIEDPVTHALSVDPNNPYSQNALLTQHYQQRTAGNTNSYAARGQLYAGSLSNAQNATTDEYNRGENSLRNNVINFLARNTSAQQTAGNNYDTGAAQALGTSVVNAPNNPLYSALSGGGGGGLISGDKNGNMAITANQGPLALVPQQPNSSVKLASGWSIVYGPDGKPTGFIPPGGK